MAMAYLVDGYNVLHHAPAFASLLRRDFETARDSFVERLACFSRSRGCAVRIVFDGKGERQSRTEGPATLENGGFDVIYSPGHHTADVVIERLAYTAASRRDVVVVTADRAIRQLCQGMGTLIVGPENFMATVNEALDETRTSVQRTQANAPLARVEDRMSGTTRDGLLALRAKLAGGSDKK